jgi:hypothetical protein
MSIPTLMIIRKQRFLFSQDGALAEAALVDLNHKVMDVGMKEVRRVAKSPPVKLTSDS